MIELEVQKYLRSGKSIEDLEKDFGITDHGNEDLAYLSYGIVSDFTNPVVRECRSLVLERRSWDVVARTFEKFGNEHEISYAHQLDYSAPDVVFYEKLDGSLITVFNYMGDWFFSTRKRLLADGEANASGLKFHALIDRAIATTYPGMRTRLGMCALALNPSNTYAFELTAPENRVLVQYSEPRLWLLAARNNETGFEIDPYGMDSDFVLCPVYKEMTRSGLDELFATKKSTELEGVVARDGQFRRVKIKNPAYIRDAKAAYAGRIMSTKRAIELVFKGVDDDIQALMSDDNKLILGKAKEGVQTIIRLLSEEWEKVKDFNGSPKDFFFAVKDGFRSDALLVRKRTGMTFDEYLAQATVPSILRDFEKLGLSVYAGRQDEEK